MYCTQGLQAPTWIMRSREIGAGDGVRTRDIQLGKLEAVHRWFPDLGRVLGKREREEVRFPRRYVADRDGQAD